MKQTSQDCHQTNKITIHQWSVHLLSGNIEDNADSHDILFISLLRYLLPNSHRTGGKCHSIHLKMAQVRGSLFIVTWNAYEQPMWYRWFILGSWFRNRRSEHVSYSHVTDHCYTIIQRNKRSLLIAPVKLITFLYQPAWKKILVRSVSMPRCSTIINKKMLLCHQQTNTSIAGHPYPFPPNSKPSRKRII